MGPFESVLDIDGNATISRGSKLCRGFVEGSEQERSDCEEPRSEEEGNDIGEASVLVLQGAQDGVRPDWISPSLFSFKIFFF